MKNFIVLALILGIAGTATAQNCSQTLRLANSTYEQGRLHELEGLLTPCLKTTWTVGEKVQAYRLLTLAYIYLEEPEKADATMLALLQTDNEFKVNKAVDPAEFIALYNTFRTDPIYRIGGKLGSNIAAANVTSADNATDGESMYGNRFGFSGAVSAEIPVTIFKIKNLTFNPELSFQITSFKFKSQEDSAGVMVRSSVAPRTLNWLSIPLSLQYQFGNSKFNPYVALGVEVAYLFSAKVNGQTTITKNASHELKGYDAKKDMNSLNYFALLSAGAKYKIGRGMAVAEIRYHQGLRNATTAEGTYANPFLTWDYHATDAVYKLNYLSLTVGYLVNIYNPKKKTFKK